jgi:hypothetical protein
LPVRAFGFSVPTAPFDAVGVLRLSVTSGTPKRSAAARRLIFSDSIAAIAIAIFDSGVAALTASVTTGQVTAQWLFMAIKTPPRLRSGDVLVDRN